MSNGFVLKDAQFTVNTAVGGQTSQTSDVDLSDHVMSVTLNMNPDTPDNTTMGNVNHTRISGLKDLSVDVQFVQDFDSGQVDATLYSLVGGAEFVISVMGNKTDGIGVTNPMFRGGVVIGTYQPLQGAVGDLSTTTITFQAATSWFRYTAAASNGDLT